ncbi:uncharacterized protein LTR77_005123 [Saxophila tyrrhenica]|uniref:Uncharacterized protein n=1 Tax=Saxophila tyrrhenica TaxID=1690608 RepID=A0AAV9PFE3_9PEZI|nr:hypothetical protein LTR77_005123 [Saxophila tyrrhenica]
MKITKILRNISIKLGLSSVTREPIISEPTDFFHAAHASSDFPKCPNRSPFFPSTPTLRPHRKLSKQATHTIDLPCVSLATPEHTLSGLVVANPDPSLSHTANPDPGLPTIAEEDLHAELNDLRHFHRTHAPTLATLHRDLECQQKITAVLQQSNCYGPGKLKQLISSLTTQLHDQSTELEDFKSKHTTLATTADLKDEILRTRSVLEHAVEDVRQTREALELAVEEVEQKAREWRGRMEEVGRLGREVERRERGLGCWWGRDSFSLLGAGDGGEGRDSFALGEGVEGRELI